MGDLSSKADMIKMAVVLWGGGNTYMMPESR